jgi:hypothetical protein
MTDDDEHDFLLRFSVDGDELVGARWWNEAAQAERRFPRRDVMLTLGLGGIFVGVTALFIGSLEDGFGPEPEAVQMHEALELQRREGWDVAKEGARLLLASPTPFDADGGSGWKDHVADLSAALEPAPLRLRPYYVPTLFQSLSQPSLRAELEPVHSATGGVAYDRASALAEVLRDGDSSDLAVILDLPGEDTVAAAAALADQFWPVFGFGNWPHPRGVVPSHQTLGAALYYVPRFRASASRLSPERPPMFVLDSQRLNPYVDESSLFDNRYLARLPSAENLRGLGIRRLMYVRPPGSDATELDDLNDEFVAFEAAGLDVRFVSLGDFMQAPSAGPPRYYWGGSPSTHVFFWPSYGLRRFDPPTTPSPGFAPRATRFEPRRNLEYRPVRRDTMFSRTIGGAPGIGKQKPSGFGLVSVRRDTATGVARTSGRSGSFGRYSGSSSG